MRNIYLYTCALFSGKRRRKAKWREVWKKRREREDLRREPSGKGRNKRRRVKENVNTDGIRERKGREVRQ